MRSHIEECHGAAHSFHLTSPVVLARELVGSRVPRRAARACGAAPPGPCPFSSMKMTPAASKADLSFCRASSETRITPSASTRLTVGTDKPARSASSPCDHPNKPSSRTDLRNGNHAALPRGREKDQRALIPKVSSNSCPSNAPRTISMETMQAEFSALVRSLPPPAAFAPSPGRRRYSAHRYRDRCEVDE